ncbi:CASP-like protein 5C1 [Papaver somniferum]|uniref:CASP-like protein 5C1 n=1 Tax=Papaver somniferum TaxID=3469 RepID=UPI000E70208E|nr:CASP-like protein 5C1 [Papaver somniferum]XP_026400098.1 CASP-like protein 5C1 [Papaver somniferum]
MAELTTSSGTRISFTMRIAQIVFYCSSLLFMSLGVEFYGYTAFCYLVTVMGLLIPWSFTLAVVDGYAVIIGSRLRQPGIQMIVIIGDWVLSLLALAAACATAGVIDLLPQLKGSHCPSSLCSRYQISAIMAFLSWFHTAASALLNLWLFHSM